MIKISVLIAGRHATSISLEPEFYTELLQIAQKQNISINQLITEIDSQRTTNNLSGAIRIYILNYYKARISDDIQTRQ